MQLHALILEPSATRRGYLWQATLAEPNFRKVKGINSLEAALAHLDDGARYDVVLISGSFERERVADFLTSAKNTEGGKESAYVLVIQSSEQSRENIALNMLDGTDGFLFVPFSVSSLREVAAVAARVKIGFEKAKKKAAITILIPSVIEALDRLALAKFCGKELVKYKEDLQKAFRPIKDVATQYPEVYQEVSTELFDRASPRPPGGYHGASERVKRMFEKHLVRDSDGDSETSEEEAPSAPSQS